jgi:hypothetical protein
MSGKLSVFRSAAAQAEFSKAYEAALGLWPVPYEELAVPTRYGETHVVACGDRRAAPLVLLQPDAVRRSGTGMRLRSPAISGRTRLTRLEKSTRAFPLDGLRAGRVSPTGWRTCSMGCGSGRRTSLAIPSVVS